MISSPILMWLYFLIFLTMNSPLLNDMLASLVAQMVKLLPAMPGFDPWVGKIPWRRKWQPTPLLLPGKSHGRRSLVGSSPWGRWVGHNWVTLLSLFTFIHWKRKWQPTPVFLPGKSQGWRSLVGCHLWSRTESDRTEAAAGAAVVGL